MKGISLSNIRTYPCGHIMAAGYHDWRACKRWTPPVNDGRNPAREWRLKHEAEQA